jgi:hypothetical protein
MGEKRNAYRALVEKPEGRRPFGRPKRRLEVNSKMDLKEICWEGVDWITVAQVLTSICFYLNALMSLWVS